VLDSAVKRGLNVYQARAGKKTIGTARPVKSSGFLTERGSETDMGMITAAKDRIEISRLKTNTLFFLEINVKR